MRVSRVVTPSDPVHDDDHCCTGARAAGRGRGGGGGRCGGGAKRNSSWSAVASKELGMGINSASSNKDGATSSRGRGGAAGNAKQAQRAAAAGFGTDAVTDGGFAYAESLAYLCSQPERALKGVGPKKGQHLAKLGTLL